MILEILSIYCVGRLNQRHQWHNDRKHNWWICNEHTENKCETVNQYDVNMMRCCNGSQKTSRVPPFFIFVGFTVSITKFLRDLHDAVFALTPPYELKISCFTLYCSSYRPQSAWRCGFKLSRNLLKHLLFI